MGSNILLVNPDINPESQSQIVNQMINKIFPTSLGVLAGYILDMGIVDTVRIIDEQIEFIEDKDIEKIATKSISEHGTGGMKTKIDAAKICQLSGCQMVIANGLVNRPIKKITEENNCTWFLPKVSKLDARKKWIISSVSPKGALIIDDGAKQALSNGKSLLAAGIKKVSGRFSKGDHIKVLDKNNYECARGLSSFSSNEIEKIMGHHSKEIEKLLGYISKSEVIHKDDIVEI